MQQILITGANRGIGLELTRQLLNKGNQVFATCRQPEKADVLQALTNPYAGQLFVLPLNVVDGQSVEAAATAVAAHTNRLDMLINNAGVLYSHETLDTFDETIMQQSFDVNVIGVMRVVTQFIALLQHGHDPQIVNITSQLGSLQKMNGNWGRYSYNSSKAALNMVTRKLAFDLAAKKIAVVAIHPGWVQTDMGGQNAAISAVDSATGILRVSKNLSLANSGSFYTYTGEVHPW